MVAKIYLNTNVPLFKGLKGNMTNVQSRLFWVTKNVGSANSYARVRGGVTRVYVPVRKLKLLKLSRESIRRLLQTNVLSPNTKLQLKLLFGVGLSHLNQYKGLLKLNKAYWKAHFAEKRQGGITPKPDKGGRISVTNSNYKLFSSIRNNLPAGKYDGIYVPEMRTPHYPQLSFPAEYILFRPRSDLKNVTAEYNLNKARVNLNTMLGEMNRKHNARTASRT